jgi:hypothetical protein
MDGVQVDQSGGRIGGPLTVVVQQGLACDETHVYSTDAVEFVAVRDGEGQRIGVFAVFVPKNGSQRGKLNRVPFDRVLSVVDA